MQGRRFLILGLVTAVLLTAVLLSCDDGADEKLAGEGESCATEASCEPGLKCMLGICGQEELGCPNTGDCAGLECGSDPVCGVLCGVCAGTEICQDSMCVEVKPGPWYDATSELSWENPAPGEILSWESANEYCASLSLDNGGWHLPTIDELRSLIDGCVPTDKKGGCNVSESDCLGVKCKNAACDGCDQKSGWGDVSVYWSPNLAGECCMYWSSTLVAQPANDAWMVNFNTGQVFYYPSATELRVRCVK